MGGKRNIRSYAVLSVLAAALLLPGCRRDSTGVQKERGGKEVSQIIFPLKDTVTITALVRSFNRDKTQYVDKLLEKRTNLKINWIIVPFHDYQTVLELKINSGELPDLFELDRSTADHFSDQGIFANIAEYLDEMPNLQAWIEKIPSIYNDSVDSEGRIYSLTSFNTRGQVPRMSIYRKDIFDKEGLKAPETVDELYEELVILKKKYPDSLPIVNRWGQDNLINHVANLYHTKRGFYLDNDSLVYEYGPVTEAFRAAISTMQKFYMAGLIDPDFATTSEEQYHEYISSGKALFLFSGYMGSLNTELNGYYNLVGKGKKTNPDFELVPLEPLDTEHGNGLIEVQYPTSRGIFGIGVNAESEYINEIIAYLDYQLSDEIISLANWGVEGETYEFVDGEKQWIIGAGERDEKGLDARSGIWIPIDQDCGDSVLDEKDQEYTRYANENIEKYAFYEAKKTLVFNAEERKKIDAVMEPIEAYCDEQLMNFITGTLNMEEDWEEFVRTIAEMGYKEILQLYRDKYEELPEDQKGLDTDLGF